MNLENKVALVTGGVAGIGWATANVLAERGARVAITQLPGTHPAATRSPDIFRVELDIRDQSSVERAMEAIVLQFGGLDVLVNNASVTGSCALSPFLSMPTGFIHQVVDTNLKGTVYCSQAAARHMIKQGRGGVIIHVSSVGAYAAQERASLYCATKAAQVALAKAMAVELAPHAIRVNAVAPGDIRTESSEHHASDAINPPSVHQFSRFTPMGRRGQPEEVGRAIAFLASDDASFITGATVIVDGGFLSY
jgi:NAD(P)-dependent dehydrogenase (short-subunit alcohol dehydrogenase family)